MEEQFNKIILKYNIKDEQIFFAPQIPQRKLSNAIAKFAPNISEEDVIALLDDTLFGGGKEGIIFARQGFFAHEVFEENVHYPIDEIKNISHEGKMIFINDKKAISLSMVDKENLTVFCLILLTFTRILQGHDLDLNLTEEIKTGMREPTPANNLHTSKLQSSERYHCLPTQDEEFSEHDCNQLTVHTPSLATTERFKELSNTKFFVWVAAFNLAFLLTILFIFNGSDLLGGVVGWVMVSVICFVAPIAMLYFSKFLTKKAHGVKIIDEGIYKNDREKFLYETVRDLAERAELPEMPEVGYYYSPDINAFATGASKKDSLVAFTSALLDRVPPEQIRAIAAHEVAHIANMDMMGTVMIQGIINWIVLSFCLPIKLYRFFFHVIKDEKNMMMNTCIDFTFRAIHFIIAQVILVLGNIIAMFYSRTREYKADEMASLLVGPNDMINALRTIGADTETAPAEQAQYAAFKISNSIAFAEIFSTHPSIEKRIAALREKFAQIHTESTTEEVDHSPST